MSIAISGVEIIEHLILKKELSLSMIDFFLSSISDSSMSAHQISAVLALMRAKMPSALEISEFSKRVLEKSKPFMRPDYHIADIVGTGGDGYNTINISTISSLVAASCGLSVAKHGNFGTSSMCGSADLLAMLGLAIDLSPQKSRECLDKSQWCFLFAPLYHPFFLAIRPLRQELKIKTIFNIIGPLLNPSRPDFMLVGVYEESLLEPIANALNFLGVKRALVVHGSGLDEIALHANTSGILVDNNKLDLITISPKDFALEAINLNEIVGGSPQENAKILVEIFSAKTQCAKTSVVAANAGALLWIAGLVPNLREGFQVALAAIFDKDAQKTLDLVRELNA